MLAGYAVSADRKERYVTKAEALGHLALRALRDREPKMPWPSKAFEAMTSMIEDVVRNKNREVR